MTYISRVVSLKGFHKIVIGRDMDSVLDEGIIYGVQKVMGIITLVPVGEAVTPDQKQKASVIMLDGKHYLTKDEYRNQLISEDFLDEKQIEDAVNGINQR